MHFASFHRLFSLHVFQAEQHAPPEVCALHCRPLSLPLRGKHLPRHRIQRPNGRWGWHTLSNPPSMPNVSDTSAVVRVSMPVCLPYSADETRVPRKYRRRTDGQRTQRRASVSRLTLRWTPVALVLAFPVIIGLRYAGEPAIHIMAANPFSCAESCTSCACEMPLVCL